MFLILIENQLKFDIKCISQNPLKRQTTSRQSEQLVFATDISMNAANFHGVICDNVCEGYVEDLEKTRLEFMQQQLQTKEKKNSGDYRYDSFPKRNVMHKVKLIHLRHLHRVFHRRNRQLVKMDIDSKG